MSILHYNGGAVIAMVGKNCVAIASDLRFGVQGQTLSCDAPKVWKITDKCWVGLPGLYSDAQTLSETFRFRVKLYQLKEDREISPKVFAGMVSSMLYQKRFAPWFVEPLICGLEGPENKPFITGMDLIGAPVLAEDFVLAGTCSEAMFGMAETMWRPNMEPEDLFETISQTMMAAFDRDAKSGWGAIVHVITPTHVITRTLKTRQD
eukprot:TRINITY_DN8617_c0_g1_i1.p1 TRINITY_DN8617_c0_g1~~TRINITY_DN8617_c0_g1_i1.p1  ORF type:complete len:206 (+),score=37.83 TRINITY_DN8617_c0_g1_i1:60-677(+)